MQPLTEYHTQVIKRDYSSLAASYDDIRFQGANGRFLYGTDASIVRELVGFTRASRILDVPVGTGRVLDYLKEEPISIIGCDLTPEMLEHARTHMVPSRHTLLHADASNLPISSEVIDCVISLRFFHLFAPRDRHCFVREWARVLKPGGFVLCSFTNGWYGGGINWARRLLGRLTLEFLWPGELRRLFPRWKVCAVRGNFLPFQGYFASKSTWIENATRWLNNRPPLNRLCWERFYLLRKPE